MDNDSIDNYYHDDENGPIPSTFALSGNRLQDRAREELRKSIIARDILAKNIYINPLQALQ